MRELRLLDSLSLTGANLTKISHGEPHICSDDGPEELIMGSDASPVELYLPEKPDEP